MCIWCLFCESSYHLVSVKGDDVLTMGLLFFPGGAMATSGELVHSTIKFGFRDVCVCWYLVL